jgi:ribose transport system ATP-binding protein
MPDEQEAVLRIDGLSKTFVEQRVLNKVSLRVRSGEVQALVGHNGSGKSTLVKILSGYHKADPGGRLWFGGQWHSADKIFNHRVPHLKFVHQDLGLIPRLSALDNLLLGPDSSAGVSRRIRWTQERRKWKRRLEEFGHVMNLDVPVAELTPLERTIVAVVRAFSDWRQHLGTLVLDEPTAALPAPEAKRLLETVSLAARSSQAGVIFITHRLDEVLAFSDRVSVLRDGRLIFTKPVSETDESNIIEAMIGTEMSPHLSRRPQQTPPTRGGGVLFTVEGLEEWGREPLDISVTPGEVVGLCGLPGSGYERVCPLVFGGHVRSSGSVRLNGELLPSGNPRAAIAAGFGYIPRDRSLEALIGQLSARENLTLPRIPSGRAGRISHRREREEAAYWMTRVRIAPVDPERPTWTFSGGNQQKLVLARWLRAGARVLLLEDPTQGVDVASRGRLYELIAEASKEGVAFLIASADTEELAAICTRVLIFRSGLLAAELSANELTEDRLLSTASQPAREEAALGRSRTSQ